MKVMAMLVITRNVNINMRLFVNKQETNCLLYKYQKRTKVMRASCFGGR